MSAHRFVVDGAAASTQGRPARRFAILPIASIEKQE
jgi:hypothetical protein